MQRSTPVRVNPSNRVFVGIDNGVSGAITVLSENGVVLKHIKTPVKNCLNYTKKKSFINRIDKNKMVDELTTNYEICFCMLERPMVNPMRWNATVSALRAEEATEIVFEELAIPFDWIDSKQWQKVLLPSGLDKDQTKKAADEVAKRLFPRQKIVNSDSLLIAEYCRRVKR
jgi:hypothetical protein